MNALPSPRPSSTPRRRVARRSKRQVHRQIAAETGVKLLVNVVVGVIAVSALVRLIPYNLSQQESLKELQVKVSEIEGRVDRLQADLNHNFDPKQALNVMQEQSTWSDPYQRRIVWLKPSESVAGGQAAPASTVAPTASDPTAVEGQVGQIVPPVQPDAQPNAEAVYPPRSNP